MEENFSNDNMYKDNIQNICKIFELFHLSASQAAIKFARITKRVMFVTPKSLLDLVNSFKDLYMKKRSTFNENVNTLEKGTVKLKETNEAVIKLEEDLIQKKPILREKKEIAAVSLKFYFYSKINLFCILFNFF